MNTKKFTKWLIGAFALTMAVFQPVGTLPDNSPLNTVVTAEAASTQPGKVTLRGITAVSNNRIRPGRRRIGRTFGRRAAGTAGIHRI